jgi:PII-like signaling protein
VNADCLKLTSYFGERDRTERAFLADALIDCYARHEFQTSLVMRGVEGFGTKHHLRTDRLLTLSEDLPLVSVAVDRRDRIEAALPEVVELSRHGLITLERARLLTDRIGGVELPQELHEATKLTLYVGRSQRLDGRAAYAAIVGVLHDHGVAGATVLLGVDGTARGRRRRARFFGANTHVPVMIIAVGAGDRIASALGALDAILPRPLATLERVRVCKRDGHRLAEPLELSETDPSGLGLWQKLMVYCSEQSRHDSKPLYRELVRRLRMAGAMGATSLRGVWGYHGDHEPHGDSFWQLERRVPVVTVIVDTPTAIRRWFDIVDECTDETGLVTSEIVPAFRARAPGIETGGLRLAGNWSENGEGGGVGDER